MKAKIKENNVVAGAGPTVSEPSAEVVEPSHPADFEEVKWRVRAEDGSVFGPASMAALLAWARDGRLSPGHLVASDDENWVPVTSLRELAMDWVAEVSPGRFYGPIHHDAVIDLIRSQTISPDLPKFVRTSSLDESPAALRAENESLRRQISALREDFSRRAADLEAGMSAAEAVQADLRGQLDTRDMDFEAERQSFRAAESALRAELAKAKAEHLEASASESQLKAEIARLEAELQKASAAESSLRADLARLEADRQDASAAESRLKADVAKLESRASALAKQVEQASGRERAHAADTARIAELEKMVEDGEEERRRIREEANTKDADARRGLREAETALLKEREEHDKFRKEAQVALERAKNIRLREESVRKLLRQALSAFDETSEEGEVIEEGETVLLSNGEEDGPHPLPPRSDLVLNAIEAQAQRELKKLHNKPFPKK